MNHPPEPPEGWYLHDNTGFFALIGPVWERWEADALVLAFTAGPQHGNQRDVVQGGMLMTLADRVMGHTLRHAVDGQPVATIQLDTQFLDAGQVGDFIEARAVLTRVTRSIAFIEGRITAGDRLLMTATGLWKRLRDEDGRAAQRFSQAFNRPG